jgi:rare lipoprotein A
VPEPEHRDTRVASEPELERDRSREADDEDRDDDDRDDDRDAARRPVGGFEQRGIASYYANKFEGRRTASGERYRGKELTAAHRTLPFGTRVRVTNLDNGRSIEVVINDRGPHVKGRIVDVSRSAAVELGMIQKGLAKVVVEVLALAEE